MKAQARALFLCTPTPRPSLSPRFSPIHSTFLPCRFSFCFCGTKEPFGTTGHGRMVREKHIHIETHRKSRTWLYVSVCGNDSTWTVPSPLRMLSPHIHYTHSLPPLCKGNMRCGLHITPSLFGRWWTLPLEVSFVCCIGWNFPLFCPFLFRRLPQLLSVCPFSSKPTEWMTNWMADGDSDCHCEW